MTIDSDAQTQTESRSNALIRRAAFAESIDPSLRHKEDNASRLIGSLNASRLSKMRMILPLKIGRPFKRQIAAQTALG